MSVNEYVRQELVRQREGAVLPHVAQGAATTPRRRLQAGMLYASPRSTSTPAEQNDAFKVSQEAYEYLALNN